MRGWLYARLSNDDDPAQNSLQNQQEICRAFAEKSGWTIVGSSADNNISGMNFSRRGLDMLTAAVQAKQVDAVLVKDLSRLGRHRTQTALFIDFLRQQQVRVISATEGVDTFCEEDDLMIGVRGLMNDYYAKDIGKKIRAGYRQKQQEGLVITPPFGYWKDRNTNQVLVYPEAAETVQLIYALYLQGCGQKEITRWLNTEGRKTPAQLRAEWCGKEVRHTHKTRDGQFLWTYASVKNVLAEEAYTGVLVNHRREYLGGKARAVCEADWLRHENFYPVIIEKAIWQQVQMRLKQQARPAVNNRTKHRYAGLLTCQDCGNVFSPMIRCWNGSRRVEYVCRGYHRNGKGYCSSHRIHEEVLDAAVQEYAEAMREQYVEEVNKLAQMQKMWALRKPILDAHILSLQKGSYNDDIYRSRCELTYLESSAIVNWVYKTLKNSEERNAFTKELLGQIKELHGIQNDIRFSKGVVYNAEKVEIHFLSSVSSVNSYVSSLKKEAGTLFFRGHADPNYILRPSIMRTPRLLQNESEIYHELIINCPDDFEKCHTHLEKLVKMQHYGLPTRLLDITRNPLVALYFACESNPESYGELVLISPENHEIKKDDLVSSFIVYALKNNDRIVMQDGAFILCGLPDGERSLEEFRYRENGKKVVILIDGKKEVA